MMRRELLAFDLFKAALFGAALLASAATSFGPFEPRRLGAIAAAWAAALVFQGWLYGAEFLSHARAAARSGTAAEDHDNQMRVGAQLVPVGAEVESEDQALEKAVSPARRLGSRLGFAAVLAVFAVARVWLRAPFLFHDVLYFVGAVLIVPAMGMNHLLLPLGVTALAMILGGGEVVAEPSGQALTAAYLAMAALALVLYRCVELAPDRPRGQAWDERVVGRLAAARALGPAVILAAALVLANCLVPGTEEAQKMFAALARALNALSAKTVKYAPEAARLAQGPLTKAVSGVTGKPRAGGGSVGDGEAGGQPGARPHFGKGLLAGAAGLTDADRPKAPPEVFSPSGELKLPFAQALPSSARPLDAEAPPPAGGAFNEMGVTHMPNLSPLEKKMPTLNVSDEELAKLAAAASGQAPPAAGPPMTPTPSGELAPEAAAEKLSALAGAGASGEDPEAAKARIAALARQLEAGAPPGNAPPVPHPIVTEAQLRRLAIVLGGLAILVFLNRLNVTLKTAGQAPRPRLTRQRRKALRAELEQLRESTRDPREEVLASYQFYLRLLAAFELGRDEWVPVEDFQRGLSSRIPRISSPTMSMTATFCDVRYGEQDVPEKRLSEFRASLGAVLKHFGC